MFFLYLLQNASWYCDRPCLLEPCLSRPKASCFRFPQQANYLPAMIPEMRSARSSVERCSSAPSTSLLSISENTMTILFF